MNVNEYLKDLSDQIRSEIKEFYTVNGAFILANSLIVGLVENITISTLRILIFINFVWFLALRFANEWVDYWILKARIVSTKTKIKSIWKPDYNIVLMKYIKLRGLFYVLPFLFSVLLLEMMHLLSAQHVMILVFGYFIFSFLIENPKKEKYNEFLRTRNEEFLKGEDWLNDNPS